MPIPSVMPREVARHLAGDQPLHLIDVRTPVEFREVHVEGAVNVPLDQLTPEKLPDVAEGETRYLICRTGSRGAQACRKLADQGVARIANVEGGTLACEAEGLPVVRGQATMSLESSASSARCTCVSISPGRQV